MKNRRNRIEFSCGEGSSDIFLSIHNQEPCILDPEFDRAELHALCGGKTYYLSRSGYSGAGYLDQLGSLIPIGTYRIDTKQDYFVQFMSVGKRQSLCGESEDILVAVPYAAHTEGKSEILQDYPTVIKVGYEIIYCSFVDNFVETLKELLTNDTAWPKVQPQEFKKTFTSLNIWSEVYSEEVSIKFHNLCSMKNTPSPWIFFQDELEKYEAANDSERLHRLLSVEKVNDKDYVRVVKIGGLRYRGRILNEPLVNLPAGWQRLNKDLIVRDYQRSSQVHLVAYVSAKESRKKIAQRLARHLNEGEEFISVVSGCHNEYDEFELIMPKTLWLIDQETQIVKIRQGLAKKIREDVTNLARQWVQEINDRSILEAIPDDTIITFQDSLDAGNCSSGTEDFIKRFFPGQRKVTAKKLKKYADNYDVMRVFRHLVAVGRFSCPALRTT